MSCSTCGSGDRRSRLRRPTRRTARRSSRARPLKVLYPTPGARLQTGRDFDGKRQKIVLSAAHRDRDRALFWYVDRRFLGRTVNRHRMAVSLEPGGHALEIVDAHGFRDRARFRVMR